MFETDAALLQLKWAVQALAADPTDQMQLHPKLACTSCELMNDFDNWYGATRWRPDIGWTETQHSALTSIAEYVGSMDATPCFDNGPLHSRADWARLRELARQCLNVLNWGQELPPTARNVFVPGA
jgi:hypothetical protein